MKRLFSAILVMAFIVFYQPASAQLRKIPGVVTDAFKTKYPEASNVEWKDKLSVFQADFEINDVAYQARFNGKGEWQETEKMLEESALPADVKDGFSKSKYTDWELKNVSYLEKKEVVCYRILVRKNEFEKKYLFFDTNGKLIKEQITL